MLLLIVQVGERLQPACRLPIPQNALGALIDRRGAVLEPAPLAMGMLIRCKVLRRHAS